MNDNTEETNKQVTFEGLTYTVPTWVKWVARDADGEVYGYRYEPIMQVKENLWGCLSYSHKDCLIKIVETKPY